MILVSDLCFRCNACKEACPAPGTITKIMPGRVRINHGTCIDCEQCLPACPVGALSVAGAPEPVTKASPNDVYMDIVSTGDTARVMSKSAAPRRPKRS